MIAKDEIAQLIEQAFRQGEVTGITFSAEGRMMAWHQVRGGDSHLYLNQMDQTWRFMGFPVTIDAGQSEPWTVQHDGRYAVPQFPARVYEVDSDSDGAVDFGSWPIAGGQV